MRNSGFLEDAWAGARRLNRAAGQVLAPAMRPGETRRQVLQALAGVGAVAMLPHPVHARGSSHGPVAIVGGGIAGLSALWHLTDAGIEAHLFEARGRLGGRMFTQATPHGAFEVGGQLVNSDHADMHRFARLLAIPLIDRKGEAHHTLVTDDGRSLATAQAAEALTGIAGQIDRDAARLDRDYATVAAELDQVSVVQYLDRYTALMPQPWVRRLMEATCHTEYGSEPHEVSALELIFNMPTVEDGRFDVLGKSDERYLIAGGSASIPRALGARLAHRISAGRRVLAIDTAPGGVVLRFARGPAFHAARVIVATPGSVTRRIAFGVPLPALWRRYIAEVNLGRNEKVQVATGARPWEAVFGRGGELWQVGRDWAVADLGWDGGVRPDPRPGSTWTWFLGGNGVDRLDRERAVDVARGLAHGAEAAIPGMAAATVDARATAWRHDPMARGAYVNYRPGQLTTFASCIWTEEADGTVQPVLDSGRVHFAGEHLSDAFPGYMNGGAQTGRLAATAVARAMSRSVAAAA